MHVVYAYFLSNFFLGCFAFCCLHSSNTRSGLRWSMEPDSESRDCLAVGTSNKPEEGKVEDTESGISCTLEGDGPPFRENVDLKPGRETPKKQLCGYLNKFSAKAPIKTWKSRWFFYDENKCHLLYYRTAQDINPLGSIELSSASFDLKVGAEEGVFEIRTPSKTFILQAVDKQTMIYWLQQLQIKRWEFYSNQTRSSAEDDTDFPCVNDATLNNKAEHEFLPPVKTPTDVVGLKAASLPAPLQPSHALQNISLKHPWIEIQNTVHNLCGSWQSRRDNGGMPCFEGIQDDLENTADEEHAETQAEDAGATETQKDTKSRLKPPSVRKDKKESRSLPCFAEGTRDGRTASLQHQILVLEEDVKSQKELVKLLHKALEAAQHEKRESCRYLVTAKEEDRLELVRHKVRQIAELNKQVEVLEMEKKELEQGLALKDEHIGELKAHVQLLMDKNQAKQQVILKLTEQLARDMPDSVREADPIPMETLYKQQEEIEHLKDDLEAYKIQNQFLNCEIHQVTKIWSAVAQKEKTLLMKCARLQAHNCQIESKYLMILRKLQGLPDFASEHVEMLKGLIQEALQWGVKEEAMIPVHLSPINQYDDYGFMTIPEYEAADWKLLAKIQALEIKSSNLLNQDAMERTLSDRWNNLGELTPSSELKSLLRCGVPIDHRQRVWRWIVSRRVQHIRSPGHYQSLLKKCEVAEHPASRQIELDLPRTLTNNRHFSSPASQYLPKLRRILLAFSLQNPTIGYCQGLNRLAAIALLVLEEEENAFWCLVHITENLMPPDYYSNTLIGSQVDQRVFKDFLSEKLPRLTAHLEQHRIDLGLVTFNWFLVVFVDSLVSDILFRVWDAFLYEGTKVIFRYALAIFKYNEEAILRIQDSLEIYQYMRFFTKTICDGRKLMNIAFSDMNPFPMKVLQNRRRVYRLKLESEMRELEQIKVEYMKEQAEHAASNSNGAVSEDEEDM
ncbi:TBC1 domain family member 2A isoform X2 [Zootoca vivipara]|uniref:TBC1 domain family member 2A isoform X2 n=1 Tax=Zootoca vivipara TaxID=8524 RepID=UPI00293BDB00|nr:TBC1 domain family member 2A isoform X2 [Zootoca vivipara]